ncbi:MAG TPA: response regulator transcription factor [Saprospiraceae bacterium]|nr:response regulator transcription factor [Saprospiraceae bacterium]MCB9327982.1 response regulator transcription factor [Lewinellaceae bacterium]HPK08909.1 response regulator transcription factor [Saprospiraceae bacterium]HPQ20260.1 response regulator transcription factor [Saprospiraceae bacterium]HRX28041.1 response regulator transcription factor [Saprospiraceae bacterium]
MESKARIFYVEDDQTLSFLTKDSLELNGFEVSHFENGEDALKHFNPMNFDLCLLDVMLPKLDGFGLAEKIRGYDQEIPIIFLTAKSLKEDKIQGLTIGADDYITKPFSIEELLLKIDVFLKRKYITNAIETNTYTIGNYNFDYKNLELTGPNFHKTLTQKEADLLKLLWTNKNQVLKRGEILIKVWGEDDYFLGRSMDVFISRLRKYLENDDRIKIENVHGVGFKMIF